MSMFQSLPGLSVAGVPALNSGLALKLLKGTIYGVLASSVAILYSEVIFQGTLRLYAQGKLQRYYPMPKERGWVTAWINSMSFTVPTAIVTVLYPPAERSFSFNPIYLAAYMVLYMVIHDTFFFWIHRSSHVFRPLYDYMHAMHHEYSYSMHVYIVGHAEMLENFIQVGVPWIAWALIASHNWWYFLTPLSYVLFSTLVGHSGYRSNYHLLKFHPLALLVALASGDLMLTTGDHQMHHSHRRVNFGLFWRFWDQYMGSYRKCETRAHDIKFWTKWAESERTKEFDAQARKWLGKNQVEFHEVEWGF